MQGQKVGLLEAAHLYNVQHYCIVIVVMCKQYQIPLCPSAVCSTVPGTHAHMWRSIYNRDLVVRAVDTKLYVQPAPLIMKV